MNQGHDGWKTVVSVQDGVNIVNSRHAGTIVDYVAPGTRRLLATLTPMLRESSSMSFSVQVQTGGLSRAASNPPLSPDFDLHKTLL